MKWLFDTNVISESVQQRPNQKVLHWVGSETHEAIAISIVTLAELRDGASSVGDGVRRKKLLEWVNVEVPSLFHDRILPLTTAILIDWIRLARRLRARGAPREATDLLIASTARVHNLVVVSRNVRHFAGTGVILHDPWTARTHHMDTP